MSLRAEITDILNIYAQSDPDGTGVEWIEPEDVWRLFRDLRAALARDVEYEYGFESRSAWEKYKGTLGMRHFGAQPDDPDAFEAELEYWKGADGYVVVRREIAGDWEVVT